MAGFPVRLPTDAAWREAGSPTFPGAPAPLSSTAAASRSHWDVVQGHGGNDPPLPCTACSASAWPGKSCSVGVSHPTGQTPDSKDLHCMQ